MILAAIDAQIHGRELGFAVWALCCLCGYALGGILCLLMHSRSVRTSSEWFSYATELTHTARRLVEILRGGGAGGSIVAGADADDVRAARDAVSEVVGTYPDIVGRE